METKQKNRPKGYVKIFSCVSGKLVRYATAIVIALTALSSCSTDSWTAYCERYGVDPNNPTPEETDYFLDAYVGSIEDNANIN